MTNIIIAGSRFYTNYANIKSVCDNTILLQFNRNEITIFHGGCRGVDSLAKQWADENNIKVKEYPADWSNLGRSAGPLRNEEMAKDGHILIAFYNGKSTGTANMISQARKYKLKTLVVSI